MQAGALRIVDGVGGGRDYDYELRRDQAIVATGTVPLDREPRVGELISIGAQVGTVRSIVPATVGRRSRLIVQLTAH